MLLEFLRTRMSINVAPIISFRVYNRTIIVLNSVSAIRALLDHRAAIYSERPMSWMYNVICARGQAVFNVSASDPRHRVYRRLLQTGLSRKAAEGGWKTMSREAKVLVQSLGSSPERWTQHVRRYVYFGVDGWTVNFGYVANEHC